MYLSTINKQEHWNRLCFNIRNFQWRKKKFLQCYDVFSSILENGLTAKFLKRPIQYCTQKLFPTKLSKEFFSFQWTFVTFLFLSLLTKRSNQGKRINAWYIVSKWQLIKSKTFRFNQKIWFYLFFPINFFFQENYFSLG